jgi:ACS family tartrate transporter-like MFS transporter
MLGMVISYIDRMNISIAQLQMSSELGLSPAAYGLGAGLFFIGYFIFEVPSNMMMERVGARVWLARIMITWGIISSLMFLARTEAVFYILRFLLGVAEAGFFPGLLLYVTKWTSEKNRAMSSGAFLAGGQIGMLIGYPISGLILDSTHGMLGLSGWQWLFLLEGIPAFILGIVYLFVLRDGPSEAKWLNADEKAWLQQTIQQEREAKSQTKKQEKSGIAALGHPTLWFFALIYFLCMLASYGLGFWTPRAIELASHSSSAFVVGLLSMGAPIATILSMIFYSRHSDMTGERRWHLTFAALLGAAGLAVLAIAQGVPGTVVAIFVASLGIGGTTPIFWSHVNRWLSASEAAVGLALVNSIGNLGGFAGPYLTGSIESATGSFGPAMYVFAGGILLVALMMQFSFSSVEKTLRTKAQMAAAEAGQEVLE